MKPRPKTDDREHMAFTTKVLASILVFLTLVLFAGMVYLVVESNRHSGFITADYKALVRVCLQTPGCMIPDDYLIDRKDCIETPSGEYWQIRYRDETTSITPADCSVVQTPLLQQPPD